MKARFPFVRSLSVGALALFGASGAFADASWDLDACTGGSKWSSGYTSCGSTVNNGTASGVTVNIKAYSSSGWSNNFTTASTSINNGGSYLGVWSGNENNGGYSDDSPHHSIDNVTSYGRAFELVHMQFSKAVDLSQLVATWAYSDGDFQVFRWNYNAGTPDPTITNFNPNTMTGWQSVTTADFKASLTQGINDGTYYSSHWLVTTAFGGNNDGFKLGTVIASGVCAGGYTTGGNTSTGGCATNPPPPAPVPEPASMALAGLALAGLAAQRRRRKVIAA